MKSALRIVFVCVLTFCSCKKQNDWLDEKRQISDNVPKTLKDFQAIIDNSSLMNGNYPTIGLLGTDNYYFLDGAVQTINNIGRNSYLWNKDIFEGDVSSEYNSAYSIVASANIILEGVETLDKAAERIIDYNNVKGQRYFLDQ